MPPPAGIDVFLQPGDFYFGDRTTRLRTVLGSCVSITMWHPTRCIGGMCHYLLPSRHSRLHGELDGRYADEAIAMFQREIRAAGTHAGEYQVKIFGGGNMFPGMRQRRGMDIGGRNVEAGRLLLRQHGFPIVSEHLAGHGHRSVIFEVWSGDVWIRHSAPRDPTPTAPAPAARKLPALDPGPVSWSDGLKVHVDEMDTQHRWQLALLSRLDGALRAGEKRDITETVLRNLFAYTKAHFADEERLMLKHGYPRSASHVSEHARLVDEVSLLMGRIKDGRAEVTVETLAYLRNWVEHHIRNTDMELGRFLSKKGVH